MWVTMDGFCVDVVSMSLYISSSEFHRRHVLSGWAECVCFCVLFDKSIWYFIREFAEQDAWGRKVIRLIQWKYYWAVPFNRSNIRRSWSSPASADLVRTSSFDVLITNELATPPMIQSEVRSDSLMGTKSLPLTFGWSLIMASFQIACLPLGQFAFFPSLSRIWCLSLLRVRLVLRLILVYQADVWAIGASFFIPFCVYA